MIDPTQVLSKSETATLMALVREQGLSVSRLQCEMSRQQGEGRGRFNTKGILRGETYSISYDLKLCAHCGNLEPQKPACPAKLRVLKERLLTDSLRVLPE